MKTLTLSGSQRTALGKKGTHALRKEGKVPCILYGGKDVLHFEAIEKDFKTRKTEDVEGSFTNQIYKSIQKQTEKKNIHLKEKPKY